MLEIIARDVCIEFPVYDSRSRSLRHTLVIDQITKRFGHGKKDLIGGHIKRSNDGRVVITALHNASFEIKEGDRVGLIGHNGAGKSSLLRAISGIYEPLSGELLVHGDVMPLFNISEGIDIDATGLETIKTRGLMLGMTPQEIQECSDEVAEFTELGDYIYMPIRTYSSGMLMRLAFAVATAIKPDILLLDELIGAGDAHFIDKAEQRMKGLLTSAGILVVATHSMEILRQWCNKAILLHKGEIREFGEIESVISAYEQIIS